MDKYTQEEYIKLRNLLANWNPFLSVQGRIALFDEIYARNKKDWDFARRLKPNLSFEGTSDIVANDLFRKLRMHGGDEELDRYLNTFRNKLNENDSWEAQLKIELEKILDKYK